MSWRDRLTIFAVLAGLVAVLFHQSFKPELVHFSSDGPLGMLAAQDWSLPGGFTGFWLDSNWLGAPVGVAAPSFTTLFWWLLGPVGTAKFLAPLFVLSLGLSAAFCFRLFGFRPMVCLLGGMAAELNSNFLSNACWGVGTRCSCLAATFLALGAIWSSRSGHRWLKLVLAGFATGLAVMEGADNGAIFSLFIAAFAFYVSLIEEGPAVKKVLRGFVMVAVVAVFAGFISYQTVRNLVGTQITGKEGMAQTAETKEDRWHPATQWSLPPLEMLRVVIPGVFGYRQDTPEGGEYWGRVGEWGPAPQSFPRSSGAGEYAGVLVVLIAAWALTRSFSKKAETYSTVEKKVIWFWAVMAVVAALFAWGRHAPFYRLLYELPYFSTIRNPMKFMHPFHMVVMILFAYGLQGLSREYFENLRTTARSAAGQAKGWLAGASGWEKLWTYGSIGAVAVAALGWLIYSSAKSDVVRYMSAHQVGSAAAPEAVARFSIHEVAIFALVLAISTAVVLLIQSGKFRGPRALWAGALLGLILFADFYRASTPWIQYYDYKSRYASNPVLDVLRDKPYEHRVAMPPFQLNEQFARFQQFHHAEWVQHQFQYYNVQSMDMPQEPRPPLEKTMYLKSVGTNVVRYWQLTNTRYLFGLAGLHDMFNQQLDPAQKRFRQVMTFTLFQKPGTTFIGAETNATGPFSLMEFTGALPRAKLYSQWRVSTNDTATLATLGDPAFNPEQSVLVHEEIPAAPAVVAPDATSTLKYESYGSKHLEQRVTAAVPSVLLVNDRHDADWQVTVDGQPARLLRCNFIMRGVQIPTGQHTVVWQYRPKMNAFYVSLTAIIMAFVLCVVVGLLPNRSSAPSR